MASLKEILEAIVPTERGIYTGEVKPRQYCTFQVVLQKPTYADDRRKEKTITYRVTLFSKGDYEDVLERILETLENNNYTIVDEISGENYETDTGYWVVPINIQFIKED